ncbi:hypothetical protein LX90_008940 [Lentzea flava]|nr:hypothetical protein [Lentzea flava]
MVDAERTGGNLVTDLSSDPAQRGLHRYVQLVAAALGADLDRCRYEWDTQATAYLPLPQHIPGMTEFPAQAGHRLALAWDEQSGWSAGVDTGNDFLVLATYLDDIVPAPRVVAAFVCDVADGTAVASAPSDMDTGHSKAQVRQQLTAYAPTGPDTPTDLLPPRRL